ncbi:MAG: hypothetical protein U0U67_07780 [Chitinophagales bacterium]
MSKYNIIIRNVSNIDDNVKFIINNFFSEKDLEKLKRFGGRIQISISSPYNEQKKSKIDLTDDRLKEIISIKDKENFKKELGLLSTKDLKRIAILINTKLSLKANKKEIIGQIYDNVISSLRWSDTINS